jgi:Cof subfamily protein (haloacid dehalogenase superfamily)
LLDPGSLLGCIGSAIVVGVKYKMIAIDLDGTLLSPSSVVTARTKAAVQKAASAGLLICFATGRSFTESRAVIDSVAHFDAAIFVGGALIVDTGKRSTIQRTLMDPALARELCGFFESHGHAALALQDTSTAGIDYLASSDFDLNPATQAWCVSTRATLRRTGDLTRHSHDHTLRVSFVASKTVAPPVYHNMRRAFGDRIVSHFFLPPGDIFVGEAFDPSVNKWQGILQVARLRNIRREEIVAIGDDINDVAMIKNAGLGIAMGNCCEEVRNCAGRVIGHNADDGLACFLEELIEAMAAGSAGRN